MTKKGFPLDPINKQEILKSDEFQAGVKPLADVFTPEELCDIIFEDNFIRDLRLDLEQIETKCKIVSSIEHIEQAVDGLQHAIEYYSRSDESADVSHFVTAVEELKATHSELRMDFDEFHNTRTTFMERKEWALYKLAETAASFWWSRDKPLINNREFRDYIKGVLHTIAPEFTNDAKIRRILVFCRESLGETAKEGRPKKLVK